jgi:Leucine-rich repeat (LRR) protein
VGFTNYIIGITIWLGFDNLQMLESLSLAHNLLTSEATSVSNLSVLKKLKKLDLSKNGLITIPECLGSLIRYCEVVG